MKLDGIRQKVFLDRYSLKDKKGNPIEKTPEEMWKRVAGGVASYEKDPKKAREWSKKFYTAMQDFKYVPGGRILSGAGTGYKVTFYNCLPPSQEVLTVEGYKPIKDIKVGDLVISGKKRARKVKHVFVRKTAEPLYHIKVKKIGFDEVRLTGEHPILAIKKEWVNEHRSRDGLRLKNKPAYIAAKDIQKGDFVAVSWNAFERKTDTLALSDYLPKEFSSIDGYIWKTQLRKRVKDEIKIDENFMLLAGTWLGDGCVTHRTGTDIPAGIQITFNSEQRKQADHVAAILQEKFQVIPTVREDRWGQKLIQVRVESLPVGLLFKNLFGYYSYGKRIPQILARQPLSLIYPLIKGLFLADGYLSKEVMGILLANKTLATQLHELLLRTGRFFTIFENTHRLAAQRSYRVQAGVSQANGLTEYVFNNKKKNLHHDQNYYLEHDGLYWVRVDSIKTSPYEGYVYDLEVDEDHSFVTAGVVVSNCYVLPCPKDSRDGILDNLKEMVEIMARGGGVGINLSSLRPRGARVRKVNGFSSGPMNWAELYSVATHDIIQQGGTRRGALMLMLWDWHPDIEEFITVKQDLSRITGANLSVCVSDSFMEAVEKDKDWELVFPDFSDPEYDEKWDGYLPDWIAKKKKVIPYKKIKARKLWDLICQAAWRSAEPGVVFMERYNKMHSNYYFNRINCVNPCVTGDTLVSTTRGVRRMKGLYKEGKPFLTILDGKPYLTTAVKHTGVKQIFRLKTKEGYTVRLTEDHKVFTESGKIPAGKLTKGMKLILSRGGSFGTSGTEEEGLVYGWLVGDGSVKKDVATLYFYKDEKRELAPAYAQFVHRMVDGTQITHRQYPIAPQYIEKEDKAVIESTRLWRLANSVGITHQDKYQVPQVIFEGARELQKGFLKGLFSSDGHVSGTSDKGMSIRLTSVSENLLIDVQRLLLNFGIVSNIYKNRRQEMMRMLPDGKGGSKLYQTQAYHDLVVSKSDLDIFAGEINFLQKAKQLKLANLRPSYKEGPYQSSFKATFDSLEKEGVEDVYDITVSDVHRFSANGIVVSNCGEEGLPAYGVCNLGSLNLTAFVNDKGEMDYDSLYEHAKIGTRFQDNIIDGDIYIFPGIRKTQLEGERRIGLGTMGLGDALIKMKMRYGSEQSIKVINKIYKLIRDAAFESSIELAREKGAFPKFEKRKYLKGYFIKKLSKKIAHGIAKYGVRNSVLLMQAPTGSTSLMAGVSSGIEPVYEFSFIRRDRLGEHKLYHPLFDAWRKAHPKDSVPEYFVSSSDLTPADHVKVQAAIQEYVDASISKTVNAPNVYTVEDVKKLYTLAYKLGCKGITFMRDGSRPGVLEKENSQPVEQKTNGQVTVNGTPMPVKKPRPMVVHGSTYQVSSPVGITYITINSDYENEPFEVFVTVGKAGSDVGAMADAIGRLISLNLRLASPLSPKERAKKITDQLIGIGGARSVGFGDKKVRSLPDAIAKVLSTHFGFKYKNGNGSHAEGLAKGNSKDTVITGAVMAGSPVLSATTQSSLPYTSDMDLCPECGVAAMAFEEGCKKCYACGYSEC